MRANMQRKQNATGSATNQTNPPLCLLICHDQLRAERPRSLIFPIPFTGLKQRRVISQIQQLAYTAARSFPVLCFSQILIPNPTVSLVGRLIRCHLLLDEGYPYGGSGRMTVPGASREAVLRSQTATPERAMQACQSHPQNWLISLAVLMRCKNRCISTGDIDCCAKVLLGPMSSDTATQE